MRILSCSLLVAAMIATGSPAFALPRQEDPIDPTKRAPISTKDAVRPSAKAPVGNGVIGGSRVPEKRANIDLASRDKARAPIVVSESRKKSVTRPAERKAKVRRDFSSKHASKSPASIPRLDADRFSQALASYRNGNDTPANLANLQVRMGKETVDMGAINRYAGPRATLEAQGIPVTSAASGAAPETKSVPVPLKQQNSTKSE